jgi:hypothetical protein
MFRKPCPSITRQSRLCLRKGQNGHPLSTSADGLEHVVVGRRIVILSLPGATMASEMQPVWGGIAAAAGLSAPNRG